MENASSRDCWTRPREFSFDIVLWCAYNIDKGNACSNKRSPGSHPHGCPKTLSTQDEKTLIERAVCPKQTAHFFLPYLSHRYSTKARILETEPKIPIASMMHEVICITPFGKYFPQGLYTRLHSAPRGSGGNRFSEPRRNSGFLQSL